jgi:hypothetical protein
MKKVVVEKEGVEREKGEMSAGKIRKAGFWPTLDSIFFIFKPIFTLIFRWWKREVFSLIAQNLGPCFG